SNDFMADTISAVVMDTASAQLDAQSCAVFPLPLDLDRVDSHVLGGALLQCWARTEIKEGVRRVISRREMLFGFVAKHCYHGLIDPDNLPFSIFPPCAVRKMV